MRKPCINGLIVIYGLVNEFYYFIILEDRVVIVPLGFLKKRILAPGNTKKL